MGDGNIPVFDKDAKEGDNQRTYGIGKPSKVVGGEVPNVGATAC